MKYKFWRLIQDGFCDGDWNMAADLALLRLCEEGKSPPTLRLYGWKTPTLSIGHSQDPSRDVNLERCRELGIPVVRRPTGGKAVLHNNEITYSLAVPSGYPGFSRSIRGNLETLGNALLPGLKSLGVKNAILNYGRKNGAGSGGDVSPACFSSVNHFEILAGGKKLVGSAAKITRRAFLQHGSILIDFDPEIFHSALAFETPRLREKNLRALKNSVTTLNEALGKKTDFYQAGNAIREGFQTALSGELKPGAWLREEKVFIEDLIPFLRIQEFEKVS